MSQNDNEVMPVQEDELSEPPAPAAPPAQRREGVLIGSISDSEIEKAERSAARKNILVSAVLVGIIIIVGAVMYLLPKEKKFAVKKSLPIAVKDDRSEPRQTTRGASAGHTPAQGEGRAAVSGEQKLQASAFIDSARAAGGDLDKRLAFYKIAISFNRYNLAAWHGQLQAYIDLRMHGEADETEKRMTEIFGPEIFSVNSIVNRTFGELSDARRSAGGVYRVEYKSRKNDRDGILRDIFNMTRAVRGACGCQDITVTAATPSGGEMTVRSTHEASVHNFSEFSRQADITWTE